MGVTEKAVLYSRSRFSWELSEIGAAKPDGARLLRGAAAAFRRLCVETKLFCVFGHILVAQPPSGGCVLKPKQLDARPRYRMQPPSGGCVLKPEPPKPHLSEDDAAAFRRLCVETQYIPCAYHKF